MDRKVATSTTKTELDKLVRLQAFDSSYFWGESYFEKEGTQNYLVVQLMYIYFKNIIGVANGNYVCFQISKGLSDEYINYITTSSYSITPGSSYFGPKK